MLCYELSSHANVWAWSGDFPWIFPIQDSVISLSMLLPPVWKPNSSSPNLGFLNIYSSNRLNKYGESIQFLVTCKTCPGLFHYPNIGFLSGITGFTFSYKEIPQLDMGQHISSPFYNWSSTYSLLFGNFWLS